MLIGDTNVQAEVTRLIRKDSLFQSHSAAVRNAWFPFIQAMVEVLDQDGVELLSKPVTALNIMRARNVFWRYCSVNNCAQVIALATPATELDPSADVDLYQNMVYHTIQGKILKAIWRSEVFAKQFTPTPGYAASMEAEMLFLRSKIVGLNDDALKLVLRGDATMAELLAVQPTIVFRLY